MATLSELLVTSTAESSKDSPNIAQALAAGAELAMKKQQLQQNQKMLEQKKDDLVFRKYEGARNILSLADKTKDEKLRRILLNKHLPNYAEQAGLPVSPETLEALKESPEARATYNQILARVMDPDDPMSLDQAVALTSNVEELARFGSTEILDAHETKLKERGKTKRAAMQVAASQHRLETQIRATGPKKLAAKVAEDFQSFTSGGGYASAQNKIKKLQNAIDKLESGDVETRKFFNLIPFLGRNPSIIAAFDEDQKAIMDDIQSSIRLKDQLDSQFSAKEAEMEFARMFDPMLDNSANIAKAKNLLNELKAKLKDQLAAFKRHGHLKETDDSSVPVPAEPKEQIKFGGGIPKIPKLTKEAWTNLSKAEQDALVEAALKRFGYTREDLLKGLGIKQK